MESNSVSIAPDTKLPHTTLPTGASPAGFLSSFIIMWGPVLLPLHGGHCKNLSQNKSFKNTSLNQPHGQQYVTSMALTADNRVTLRMAMPRPVTIQAYTADIGYKSTPSQTRLASMLLCTCPCFCLATLHICGKNASAASHSSTSLPCLYHVSTRLVPTVANC